MPKQLTPEQYMANRGETFLDYKYISNNDIARLKRYLEEEIAYSLAAEETTTTTLQMNDHVEVRYNDDLTLKAAFFRIDSHYFDDREAISLNADGFIGLCGWADSHNAKPIYSAFERWIEEIPLVPRANGRK